MNSNSQTDALQANKRIVLESYDAMLNQHDIEAATRHFGANYKQHNPMVPDGIEGFKPFFSAYMKLYPHFRVEIKRVLAEGDFVVLHVHMVNNPGETGRAAVEIFRIDNGKIVEHWDIIQQIPEKSANNNTMF